MITKQEFNKHGFPTYREDDGMDYNALLDEFVPSFPPYKRWFTYDDTGMRCTSTKTVFENGDTVEKFYNT